MSKLSFFYKRGLVFYKISSKCEVSLLITKNRDPWWWHCVEFRQKNWDKIANLTTTKTKQLRRISSHSFVSFCSFLLLLFHFCLLTWFAVIVWKNRETVTLFSHSVSGNSAWRVSSLDFYCYHYCYCYYYCYCCNYRYCHCFYYLYIYLYCYF